MRGSAAQDRPLQVTDLQKAGPGYVDRTHRHIDEQSPTVRKQKTATDTRIDAIERKGYTKRRRQGGKCLCDPGLSGYL